MIRHSQLPFALVVSVVLLWAPLPFGSVMPAFRFALWSAVALCLLVGLWGRRGQIGWAAARGPVLCLALLATMALLQSLSWPPFVVGWLSPAHLEAVVMEEQPADAEQATGRSEEDSVQEGEPSAEGRWTAPSWDPRASRRAAIGWAATAAALLCGALLVARSERRLCLGAVVVAAMFQAVYGGPRFLAGGDLTWGIEIPSAEGRFRGTFVNPDHAAFYFGLAVPIVTAWLWLAVRRFREGDYEADAVVRVGAPLLVWILVTSALVLTQSRAGALVMVVVAFAQGALLFRRKARAALGVAAVIVGAFGAVLLSQIGEGLGERFFEASVAESLAGARLAVYRETLSAWADYPLFGSGLGSFRTLFSARAPEELTGQWWNAHSDWLELLVTGGLVALTLLGVAVYLVVRGTVHRLRSPSREQRAVAVAVLGALLAAALHSLVDFGLAMPANSVTVAVLAGLGLARDRGEPRRGSEQRSASDGVDHRQRNRAAADDALAEDLNRSGGA